MKITNYFLYDKWTEVKSEARSLSDPTLYKHIAQVGKVPTHLKIFAQEKNGAAFEEETSKNKEEKESPLIFRVHCSSVEFSFAFKTIFLLVTCNAQSLTFVFVLSDFFCEEVRHFVVGKMDSG